MGAIVNASDLEIRGLNLVVKKLWVTNVTIVFSKSDMNKTKISLNLTGTLKMEKIKLLHSMNTFSQMHKVFPLTFSCTHSPNKNQQRSRNHISTKGKQSGGVSRLNAASEPLLIHTGINLKLNTYHMTAWQLLETKLFISDSWPP